MFSEKIARFLSIILGPQMWFPALILCTIFSVGLTRHQINILLPTLLILQVLVPISFIYLALHWKKISAWDLPKRRERYPFMLIWIAAYFVSLILIHIFGNELLFNLNLILLVLTIIMLLITLFWKISFHTFLNTSGSILINFLFGGKFPVLYLTIPIIFWARYKLKRHNIAQLLAGMIVSGGVIALSFKYLGYL